MGTIWMPGGSGGADTFLVTATAEDVLAPKVIVGPDGEPIDGTMVNNGAVSHSLPINGTYPIPKGYHDGNGKVSQSIPVQGGSTTTPGTVAKTIVAANRYVNGNIVSCWKSNLIPANIKKGVPIFGVMGIAEGYFPTATDLYLRGNNIKSFRRLSGTESSASFDTGQITISSFVQIGTDVTVNFTGYSRINIQGKIDITSGSQSSSIRLIDYDSLGLLATVVWDSSPSAADYSKSIDITAFQYDRKVRLEFSGAKGAIYRIWLS